ncbi:MAG: alanine racemase [Lachnospiraceae bacterium]|nr:alanine racemase [Robinsoniella sp.]MDY3765441.1 alanine racemase [Lachnospiraceae bacterium]
MRQNSRVYAAIHLDAVEENFRQMKQNLKPGVKMIAVIKTDGYGHGAVPIARLVEPYDYIWGFAVATAQEAFTLREEGIQKPILILGYTFEEDYEQMARLEIRPAVFQYETAQKLADAAKKVQTKMKIHLALDTGMTRIGYADTPESVAEIQKIAALDGIEIEGMFTHFARADEIDKTDAYRQLERYQNFVKMLEEVKIAIPMKHCSNSAGIIEMPEANLDAVRAGITIYGIYPSEEVKRDQVVLRPVMEIKSHIVYIKTVREGVAISYGGTFVTPRQMRVATIPVGYGDGYPRSLSNKGWVLIHGKKAPILGRVCMDQFMVDVSDIPEAKELDEVTLMGNGLSVETLSKLSGRFPYEFVCDITKRVPRVFCE